MKVPDLLTLNKWCIRKFSIIIISLLFAYDALVLVDKPLFGTLLLPQLIGFILLTFVPGFILLRIFKLDNINHHLSFIIVIGLSIFFNTIMGVLLSLISILLGMNINFKALTFFNFLIAYNIVLILLLFLCFKLNYKSQENITTTIVDVKHIFLIITIPTFAVFGTYLMNSAGINTVNILLIILIAVLPFVFANNKYHVTIIFAASISILINTQLISNYLWSWDINYEYNIANYVISNGFWDPNIGQQLNSVVSIVVMAPIYSLVMDTSLVWIYKLVYPLLFSIVPIGIYYLVKNQFKADNIAYFSSFMFIFFYGFFKDMIDKQFISEIFLMLVAITIFYNEIRTNKILLSVFLIMIPLSHYGVSLIFLCTLVLAVFIINVLYKKSEISVIEVILFLLFIFAWYMYTSQSSLINSITLIGNGILNNLSQLLFEPETRSGISYLGQENTSILQNLYKLVNILMILFMAIGVIKLIISILRKEPICKSYLYGFLSLGFFGFILMQVFITFSLGMDRILQISLLFMSPFVIIGLIFLIQVILNILRKLNLESARYTNLLPIAIALFLMIYYLFSSGLVQYIVGEPQDYSVSLSASPKWLVYSDDEIQAALWINNNSINDRMISIVNGYDIIKSRDGMLLNGIITRNKLNSILLDSSFVPKSYIYTGLITKADINQSYPFYSTILPNSNKILDDKNTAIYDKN